MRLVDIGANLTHAAFARDLEAVLARARAAGLAAILVTGTSVAESRRAVALAAAHPSFLWATAGVHPHHAGEFDADTVAALSVLASEPCVVALGECGLDYYRDYAPRKAQQRAFEAQLELACRLRKPLFLHARDAHPRMAETLAAFRDRLPPAVVHCFTGGQAELRAYLELGLAIGVTGWICDERRGRHLVALVREIPLDRLLVETDAPYLVPRDLRPAPRGRRNEPAFLPHIVQALARALGRPPEEVAAHTARNAERLFGLGAARAAQALAAA